MPIPAVSGDSGIGEHLPDQLHREIMGGEFVKFQIRGRVDEHLVDGIDVDVVRRDVFQVNAVDLRADLDVTGHARNGNHIAEKRYRLYQALQLWNYGFSDDKKS